MIDSAIFWTLGMAVLALLITIAGFITGRNLPLKQKKTHIRKFAAVGFAIFAFGLPIFKPLVSSISRTKHLDELKSENLISDEEALRLEKEQTQQIERLKEEVEELRADLYAVNNYYSILSQFLLTSVGIAAVSFAFRKRKDEEQTSEEI